MGQAIRVYSSDTLTNLYFEMLTRNSAIMSSRSQSDTLELESREPDKAFASRVVIDRVIIP